MNKLMKVLVVSAVMLMATGALAELVSMDKVAPVKDAYNGMDRGMLDCSAAIVADPDGVYYGDNTGTVNNVSLYGCSTWDESGGEVVYSVTFPDDVTWSVNITDLTVDLDLAVLGSCEEDDCLIVVDYGVYVSSPMGGDFIFVVDGASGAEGTFTITFETQEYTPPPVVDFCGMYQETGGQTSGTFYGNTCDSANRVSSQECGAYTENGFEHYYEVEVPSGASFTADLFHSVDSAMWIFNECMEPLDCLGYADNVWPAGDETITYSATIVSRIVYLVIDSYDADSCGEYTLEFTAAGGAVATEVLNLDSLKALYR